MQYYSQSLLDSPPILFCSDYLVLSIFTVSEQMGSGAFIGEGEEMQEIEPQIPTRTF